MSGKEQHKGERMATLIPEISKNDLDFLTSDEVTKMKSCEIFFEGRYLATLIVPPTNAGSSVNDSIRTGAEYLGHRGNTVGGKTLEQIKKDGG